MNYRSRSRPRTKMCPQWSSRSRTCPRWLHLHHCSTDVSAMCNFKLLTSDNTEPTLRFIYVSSQTHSLTWLLSSAAF